MSDISTTDITYPSVLLNFPAEKYHAVPASTSPAPKASATAATARSFLLKDPARRLPTMQSPAAPGAA